MKIALDTNRYADLARGVREVRDRLESADAVVLPFTVLAELRCGFRGGTRNAANDAALQRFLDQPGVDVSCMRTIRRLFTTRRSTAN